MLNDFLYNCGDEVKDSVTGYSGVILCRTQWLHNCNVYGLRSKKLKDGKPTDLQYFDEPQLKLVKEVKVKVEKKKTGGPAKAVHQTNR